MLNNGVLPCFGCDLCDVVTFTTKARYNQSSVNSGLSVILMHQSEITLDPADNRAGSLRANPKVQVAY